MVTCPAPAEIADLVDGRLASREVIIVEAHLDHCSRCADLVAVAVSSRATATSDAPWDGPLIPTSTHLGRYELRRWIGRGGMGDVYEGFDPRLERPVAIKLLRGRGQDSTLAQRRLEREARTLARLSHPNVVAALDIGVFGEQLFLVMELVEGPTLAIWLKAAPRTWREIVEAFLQAGEGLAAAHGMGIIHRDFKPQNVLIGLDGKPRVSDFGLARLLRDGALSTPQDGEDRQNETAAVGQTLTVTGALLGTPRYMAPEHFAGESVDHRADQFSFCVALYEALCGRHPFEPSARPSVPAGFEAMKQAVLTASPQAPPLRRVPSRALASALLRGLSRNPEQRYSSTAELLAALRGALGQRQGRSRRTAVALAFVAAVAAPAAVWLNGRTGGDQRGARGDTEERLMEVKGQAADWTSAARVLATVDGPIRCLVTLPDRRTLRFVWGIPARAEDVDVVTGQRRPSPLVPSVYAEGCPDLSPNGRDLVYQGYDDEGRAMIFHAAKPDGSGARPVVPAAHASLQSEPKWIGSSRSFAFDLDERHIGVFDTSTKTTKVVPAVVEPLDASLIKAVGAHSIVALRLDDRGRAHIQVVSWPGLTKGRRFVLDREGQQYWHLANENVLYGVDGNELIEAGLERGEARRLGRIQARTLRLASAAGQGIGFISVSQRFDAWRRAKSGEITRLTNDGRTREVAACGDREFLVSRGEDFECWDLSRLSMDGRATGPAIRGAFSPACSRDGRAWWYVTCGSGTARQPRRCDQSGCATVGELAVRSMALSPNDERLLILTPTAHGSTVSSLPSGGGPVRELAESETGCSPVWESNDRVWISQRRKGKLVWTEVYEATGEETGRSAPGGKTCTDDDNPDPLTPVKSEAHIVVAETSEVRYMPLVGHE